MVQPAKTSRGISHPIMPFLSPRPTEAFVLLVGSALRCTARSLLGRHDDGHPARFPMRRLCIPLLGWPWLAGGSLAFSSAWTGSRGQPRCARKNFEQMAYDYHAPFRAPYMAPRRRPLVQNFSLGPFNPAAPALPIRTHLRR